MDAKIAKVLGDGRSKANRESKKFQRQLLRAFGKRDPASTTFLGSIARSYALMITLWDEIEAGEKEYLADYLRIREAIRKDLASLQLPTGRFPKGTSPELEGDTKGLDLSKLSLDEVRTMRDLVEKGLKSGRSRPVASSSSYPEGSIYPTPLNPMLRRDTDNNGGEL